MGLDRRALPPLLAGVAFAAIAFGVARYGGPDAPPQAAEPPAAASQSPAEPPPPAGAAAEASGAEAEVARLRDRLDAEVAAVAALSRQHSAALAARDAELAARDAEIARLATAAADLGSERDRLAGRLAEIEAELAERRREIAALEAELAAVRPAAVEADKLLDTGLRAVAFAAPAAGRGPDAYPLPAGRPAGLRPARPPEPQAAAGDRPPASPLAEIHFELASAELTPGARERAEAAAVALAVIGPAAIRVAGHADRTGPATVNDRLSRARAEAVAALLVAAGIPAERIEVAAYGAAEESLPVPTAPGVAEPLNRCVSISIAEATGLDG